MRLLGALWFGNPLLGEAWLGAEWGKEWAGPGPQAGMVPDNLPTGCKLGWGIPL